MITAFVLLLSLFQPATAPATQPAIEAVEIDEVTTLYLPASMKADERIDLIVHFHGGGASVASEMERLGIDAAVVVFSPGGRSSAYAGPFRESAAFPRLLEQTLSALRDHEDVPDETELGTICITSWSAGFGAVRELLKQPENAERIAGIVMADSLYSGYAGDPAEKVVSAELMAPFVAYAEQAITGERVLVVTHTYIEPPGYAGTHETADYLVETLGLESQKEREDVGNGMTVDRRAQKGKLSIVGCEGAEGINHLQHVRHIGLWLGELPLGRS